MALELALAIVSEVDEAARVERLARVIDRFSAALSDRPRLRWYTSWMGFEELQEFVGGEWVAVPHVGENPYVAGSSTFE